MLCMATTFWACSNDNDDENTVKHTIYKEGQIVCKELKKNDTQIVYSEDKVINFGSSTAPALFFINQKHIVANEKFEKYFFPLTEALLYKTIVKWAKLYSLNININEEKEKAYRDLCNYLFFYGIDPGLFAAIIQDANIEDIVNMIAVQSRSIDKTPNDMLFDIYKEMKCGSYQTRGWVSTIISVIKSVKSTGESIKSFVSDNDPVKQGPDNMISFLDESDTNEGNYTGGTYFKSDDYVLSYWVTGIMHSQVTYIVEGYYNAKHVTIPGHYILNCTTRTTYINCEGAGFVVDGKTTYSPPTNSSDSFDDPVANEIGQVKVIYGDCCCFKYYSYLNFEIDGKTGFKELSFSKK